MAKKNIANFKIINAKFLLLLSDTTQKTVLQTYISNQNSACVQWVEYQTNEVFQHKFAIVCSKLKATLLDGFTVSDN